MYIMWYDDNPKRTFAQRIADACEAYKARMGTPATLVLLNDEEAPLAEAPAGVRLQPTSTVRRNTYWAGQGGQPL
jgi:hypothetical protein